MLSKIVYEKRPNVLNFNEILFSGSRKPQFPGYRCFTVNCGHGKSGGGVGTCFDSSLAGSVLKIKEGEKNEMLVTRLDNFYTPINIINIYGEQESRTTKEDLESNWAEVLDVLADIEAKDEAAIVVGDLNKKWVI